MVGHGAVGRHADGGKQRHLGAFGQLREKADHVAHRVPLDFGSRYGRKRPAHARKEQFQIVVDLGRRADGRARIARVDLLLDGDGRRDALDVVDLGLVVAPKKLARIRVEALHIAPLPFGIESVERQRRLARPADAGDDNELVARYFYVDALQIVDAGVLDFDKLIGF